MALGPASWAHLDPDRGLQVANGCSPQEMATIHLRMRRFCFGQVALALSCEGKEKVPTLTGQDSSCGVTRFVYGLERRHRFGGYLGLRSNYGPLEKKAQ